MLRLETPTPTGAPLTLFLFHQRAPLAATPIPPNEGYRVSLACAAPTLLTKLVPSHQEIVRNHTARSPLDYFLLRFVTDTPYLLKGKKINSMHLQGSSIGGGHPDCLLITGLCTCRVVRKSILVNN